MTDRELSLTSAMQADPYEAAQNAWLRGDYLGETRIINAIEFAHDAQQEVIDDEHKAEVDALQSELDDLKERLAVTEADHPLAEAARRGRDRAAAEYSADITHMRRVLVEVATCLQTKTLTKAANRKALAKYLRQPRNLSPDAIVHFRRNTLATP